MSALPSSRIVVCVGPGGVGKTSISAALALHSAIIGRDALVCTIDPAKRLAGAMGLGALSNDVHTLSQEFLKTHRIDAKAPLSAMMLDMKRAWDALILKYAKPDTQDKILQNRYYESLSTALAGSQEYIAMEKLFELQQERQEQVIVLDTPPTTHALDFLEAPTRILDFLDSNAAKWFLKPTLKASQWGLQFLNWSGAQATKALSRFTGAHTLEDLSTFLYAMSDLYKGFSDRAKGVISLLKSPEVSFVIVTTPYQDRLNETLELYRSLVERDCRVSSIIVNRMHHSIDANLVNGEKELTDSEHAELSKAASEWQKLAEKDAQFVEQLKKECRVLVQTLNLQATDVHTLESLAEMGRQLWDKRLRS